MEKTNFFLLCNWKSALNQREVKNFAQDLLRQTLPVNINLNIAGGFLHLNFLKEKLTDKATIWAQDCHFNSKTDQTGKITSKMLKDYVTGIIIGHQEINANNEIIHQKMLKAREADLKIILCCGIDKRKKATLSTNQIQQIIKKQLTERIKNYSWFAHHLLAIAYENNDNQEKKRGERINQTLAIINYINKLNQKLWKKKIKLLYGGNINQDNCQDYKKNLPIKGFLLGRASWSWKKLHLIINLIK